MDEQEQEKIILKAQNLLPLPLIGLNQILPSNWDNIFKLNNLKLYFPIFGSDSSHNYGNIKDNLMKSLSEDDFTYLINHINMYVNKLVDDKLHEERHQAIGRENRMSRELSALIADTVKENIIANIKFSPLESSPQYEITDENIQRIVTILETKLHASGYAPKDIPLSQQNLENISQLIKLSIDQNNADFNFVEKIDINEIVLRILQSPLLENFVDSKVLSVSQRESINRQKILIDEISKDIVAINSKITENSQDNAGIRASLDHLHSNHNELVNRLSNYENQNRVDFHNLLTEIDGKLAALNENQFTLLNKQIKLALIDILGYKNGKNIDNVDLGNWVRNMFVAKEFLELKLAEINAQTNQAIKEELDQSGVIMLQDISSKIRSEMLKLFDEKNKESEKIGSAVNVAANLNEAEILRIVNKAIAVYDADKTGLVDYALESAGGQVLSTRCTESYQIKTAQITIFGIPLWYPTNTPRIAISPAVQPGECWAFQGFPGFLVLRLNSLVYITGFSMEHVPKSLTPKGKIDSAPKNFTVWGLHNENDPEPKLFGNYEYVDNNVPLQYFAVQNKDIHQSFDIVELRIESNHGNTAYTCLYRFRVHGSQTELS